MSVRFDSDRLWVYNNGMSMKEHFLDEVNCTAKKEVAGTSGSFGTGFLSDTYVPIDTPELEWVSYDSYEDKYDVNAEFMTLELEDWWTINERVNKDQTYYMQIGDDPNPERLENSFISVEDLTNETGVADWRIPLESRPNPAIGI